MMRIDRPEVRTRLEWASRDDLLDAVIVQDYALKVAAGIIATKTDTTKNEKEVLAVLREAGLNVAFGAEG